MEMASRVSATRHDPNAPRGRFTVRKMADGWTTVRYRLSDERTNYAKAQGETKSTVELLRISEDQDILTMFPVDTLPNKRDFLEPRYDHIRSISLEGFGIERPDSDDAVRDILEYLPTGFLKDPEYGLGLQKEFRSIIQAIGKIETTNGLLITKQQPSRIDGDTYVLAYRDFETVRKGINRIHSSAVGDAATDKRILCHNALLTTQLPDSYPERHRPYKPDTIFRAVTGSEGTSEKLSDADRTAAMGIVSKNKSELASSHPLELLELRREIELVTLEQLIAKLERMLVARHTEKHWQQLFVDNPFVLNLAFGLPVVSIGGQVSVGGRRLDGTGDKIADFLHRNALTDNVSLVEIKTPTSKLLGAEYRNGVYVPSAELTGAIAQVLDQRYQLQKSIALVKDASRRSDIESYAIKCMVVIGTTPATSDAKKSLELFRNSLSDVLIISFDELLVKLKHLWEFLSPSG